MKPRTTPPRTLPGAVRQERQDPHRPTLRQAVLEVRFGHTRVRRAVPPQRGVVRRGARAAAAPLRIRGIPQYHPGHPDHPDRLLRAVAYGWKQAALAESAAQVSELARELYDRLGMGGHFDKVGRSLTASVRAYNEAVATVEGTVLVRARRFRDLKVSERELTFPRPVRARYGRSKHPSWWRMPLRSTPIVGRGNRGDAGAAIHPGARRTDPPRSGSARAGRRRRRAGRRRRAPLIVRPRSTPST